MQITREMFIAAVGCEPQQDDLDRCNCNMAGSIGHNFCGWDNDAGLPRFQTVPVYPQKIVNEQLEVKDG